MDGAREDGSIADENVQFVMNELRGHFRPEFLNRLDEIITFSPLTKNDVCGIMELLISDLNKRLADREISIRMTDVAKDFAISQSYDPAYGARPLKRYLQKTVETMSARLILSDMVAPGQTIVLDVENGNLTARVEA